MRTMCTLRELQGQLVDVPLAQYIADRTCLSSSMLRRMLRGESPTVAPSVERVTHPMRFGTWAHEALLEPALYRARLAHRELLAAQVRQGASDDPALVDLAWRLRDEPDDYDQLAIDAIVKNARALTDVADWVDSGIVERTLVYRDEASGFWVRTRPDAVVLARGLLVEFKTVERFASPPSSIAGYGVTSSEFLGYAHWSGYDIQAGLYLGGIEHALGERLAFTFVIAERSPPYRAASIAVPIGLVTEYRRRAGYALTRASLDPRFNTFR